MHLGCNIGIEVIELMLVHASQNAAAGVKHHCNEVIMVLQGCGTGGFGAV